MADMITVKALKQGFYKGSLVHPGTEFQVPEGFKGKWFKPLYALTETDTVTKPEDAQEPVALSQLRKQQGKSFVTAMKK